MFSGADLYRLIQQDLDQPYTEYLNPAGANRWINDRAYIKVVQDIYATLSSQNTFDELNYLIAIDTTFSLVSNKVALSSIPYYLHYLYGQARFETPSDISIVSASNTTPIKITLAKRSKLRSGDEIIISGVLVNTNANGIRFVKQLNDFDYALYSDEKLRTPVAGNGVGSGGTFKYVYKSTLKLKRSDEKNVPYGIANFTNPFFQIAGGYITVAPDESVSVKLDYVKKLPIAVDVLNTTVDLEIYAPIYFWTKVSSEVCRLLAMSSRDGSLLNSMTEEVIENP